MMTMNYMAITDNQYEPEWMKAERYEYCENGLFVKSDIIDAFVAFIKGIFHS